MGNRVVGMVQLTISNPLDTMSELEKEKLYEQLRNGEIVKLHFGKQIGFMLFQMIDGKFSRVG